MASKNHWRGKMLVNISTAQKECTQKPNSTFTSDIFMSNSYDPTKKCKPIKENTLPKKRSSILYDSDLNSSMLVPDTSESALLNFNTCFSDLSDMPQLEIIDSSSLERTAVNMNKSEFLSPKNKENHQDQYLSLPAFDISTLDQSLSELVQDNVKENLRPEPSAPAMLQEENIQDVPNSFTIESNNNSNSDTILNLVLDEKTGMLIQSDKFLIDEEEHSKSPDFNKILPTPPDSACEINCNLESNNVILNEVTGAFEPRQDDLNDYLKKTSSSHFILDPQTGYFLEVQQDLPEMDEDELVKIYDLRKDRQFNRTQRLKGLQYMGIKRKRNENDDKCVVDFIPKEKKTRKPKPCMHNLTVLKSSRSFLCGAVNEEQRQLICEYYWDLGSWEAKKAYLKNLIRLRPIVKRRPTSDSSLSKKQFGFDCYLPDDNNQLVRVCKNFFIDTINIQNETLNQWIKTLNDNLVHEIKPDSKQKGECSSSLANRTKPAIKSESVKTWLDSLPKVPSHYCRASTSRVYVEDSFRSKSHMFAVYKKWCQNNDKPLARRKLFCQILEREKISIFRPRKDQCDTCIAFKEGNLTAEEHDLHQRMKEEAYNAKKEAISLCSPDTLVFTVDVQSVLLCPKLQVSAQYYKQKLQLHNYTIYCNNNKDVHLYVWHEGDGGVTANEFTSCLIHFLSLQLKDGFKKFIMISDGCCYQNRNKILCSALLRFSRDNDVEIEQRILEKGHTMMEVDSVHSTLERLFKPPIFTPGDYINLMAQARPSNPYNITHLDFTFFKNYEDVCQLESIRPGKKSGDPVVTDIRAILYQKEEISYKLRHPDEWKLLPQRLRSNDRPLNHLYDEPRKIEKAKYESLISLKKYMHRDNQLFYDNLQHY